MKDKDIFKQFLEKTGIKEDMVVDYRLCCRTYDVPSIKNGIVIQLKSGAELIYIAK